MIGGQPFTHSLCALIVICTMQSTLSAQDWITDEDIYRPFVEATAQAGGDVETIQGSVFIPIWGSEEDLFFADIRGTWSDQQTAEGNWGLGFRKMLDHQLIIGGYGFYDLRHSQTNNNFQQVTLGLELLTVDWDVRVNGYIPEAKAKAAPGANQASISRGTIVVNQGFEKAYYGTDFEAGYLFAEWNGGDVELRGYAGGYYFDRSAAGYHQVAGPRVRGELRIFDLDFLGSGSRVVAGAQYQYDELRGSQPSGILQVRIPFGAGGSRKLTRIQRRMLNPIIRDIDVVTNAQATGPTEDTSIVLNGQRIRQVTIIDADTVDVAQAVADAPGGPGKIIVFDGSKGDIFTTDTIVIKNGKFAGGVFEVEGLNSGAIATFGNRAKIVNTTTDQPVFRLRDDAILTGLSIRGGKHGVVANDRSGIMIVDNQLYDQAITGIRLRNSVSGLILNNVVTNAGDDGLLFEDFYDGIIAGNTAIGSGGNGFKIEEISDALVTDNLAKENGDDGMEFGQVNSNVIIANNTAMNNGGDGFDFEQIGERPRLRLFGRSGPDTEESTDPVIAGNRATNNQENGFDIEVLSRGTFTNNIAEGNAHDGFYIGHVGGLIQIRLPDIPFFDDINPEPEVPEFRVVMSGNRSLNNDGDGFYIERFADALFTHNLGRGNGNNGIHFEEMRGGEVRNNVADENDDDGFEFNRVTRGVIDGNRANDNGDDGFDFGEVSPIPDVFDFLFVDDGPLSPVLYSLGPFKPEHFLVEITNNRAAGNTENGYQIETMVATLFSGNGASGNGENGFEVEEAIAVQFSDNAARNSGLDGFRIDWLTGCFVNNVATDNQGAGYNIFTDGYFTEATGNTGSGNGSNDEFEIAPMFPVHPFPFGP